MEAVGSGIEAAVKGDGAEGEPFGQLGRVSGISDQSAPGQIFQQCVRHRVDLPLRQSGWADALPPANMGLRKAMSATLSITIRGILPRQRIALTGFGLIAAI